MSDEFRATPRDFVAVERTFPAWIRTGLDLMGLGFVLARFGSFLRDFDRNQLNHSFSSPKLCFRALRRRLLGPLWSWPS